MNESTGDVLYATLELAIETARAQKSSCQSGAKSSNPSAADAKNDALCCGGVRVCKINQIAVVSRAADSVAISPLAAGHKYVNRWALMADVTFLGVGVAHRMESEADQVLVVCQDPEYLFWVILEV